MSEENGAQKLAADRTVYVFMPPEDVPDGWADRASPLMLIPLTPDEAAGLIKAEPIRSGADRDELRLMQLVAAGRYIDEIADELTLAPRTVFRRLAQLRRRYGVASTAELAVVLARAGF